MSSKYRIDVGGSAGTEKLSKVFGVSQRCIRGYLNYSQNPPKAERVRKMALMPVKDGGLGGVVWQRVDEPDIRAFARGVFARGCDGGREREGGESDVSGGSGL